MFSPRIQSGVVFPNGARSVSVSGFPDTGSTITEPGNNYARKNYDDWETAVLGLSSNTTAYISDVASGSWGTIAYFALSDHLTTGNVLFYGDLGTIYPIASSGQLTLGSNKIKVTIGDVTAKLATPADEAQSYSVVTTFCSLNVNDENMGLITRF